MLKLSTMEAKMALMVADCLPISAVLSVGFGLNVAMTPLSEACSRDAQ